VIGRIVQSRWGVTSLAVALVAILVGSALAYFVSAGAGSGSATAGTAQDVILSAAYPATELYPGGSADVSLTVANPNAIPVTLPQLSLNTGQGSAGFEVDTGHLGCNPAALSFTATPQTNGGAGWVVPANAASFAISLTGAVSLASSAADECQGATFTVYLEVGA
jgi:hypothetical protein